MGNYIQKFLGLLSLLSILSITNGNAQTNVSGVISTNTTWTKAGSPYILTANILVNTGISLTIEPGASVKVNENYGITINGTLIANGNSTDSIYFLNNISNKKWSGITFTSSSVSSNIDISDNYIDGSILNYVSISSISSSNGAVYLVNNALLIKNSSIFNNSSNGIYFDYNGSFTFDKIIIKGCKISNNDGSGVSYNGYRMQGTLKVLNNLISNNSGNGITTGGGDAGGSHVNIFSNNDIISNGGVGIIANANGTQTLSYNLIYLNSNGIYSRGNGTYTISKNRIISNIGYALNCIYTTHIINNNIVFGNNGGVLFSQGGDYTINNNSFINNNYFAKSNGSWTSPINIHHNLISKNKSKTENLITTFQPESGTPDFKINNNNIVYNDYTYLIYNNRNITGNSIDAANNYWGTTNLSSVQNLIYDFNLNSSKSVVTISPLTSSIITSSPITDVKDVTKNLTGSGIVLTWSANTESDVSGYKIYYGGYTGYSYTNSVDVGNVTSTTVSAGIGIDENFAVTAYDASKDGTDDQFDGNESWHSTANKIPNAPSNLAAVSSGHKVKLNWDVSTSSGVNNYNIYRSTDGVSFTKLISTTNNTYTNTGLTAYTKYYYKVAAFDSLDLSYDGYGIESALSSAVNAIPTNIFYVDSAIGIDINGFGSLLSPYKTIQTAIDLTIAGDTVYVKPGTYKEQLSITKGITVESTDGASKTIILQEALLDRNVNINNNFALPYLQVNIKGFKFSQTKQNRNQGYGIGIEKKSFAIIEACYFEGFNTALSTYYGYYNVKNSVFFDNDVIASNDVGDSDVFPIFQNCTIVNTSQVISNSTSVVHRIYNTIIVNDKSKIYNGTPLGGGTKIPLYNVIMDTLLKDYSAADGSTIYYVNRAEDMKFTNLILKDFSLSNASPAIGVGNTTLSNITDFLGVLRPNPSGSNPDIGAFESIYKFPAPFISKGEPGNKKTTLNIQSLKTNIVNYKIYRSAISISDTSTLTELATIDSSKQTYIDTIGLINNTKYYYRVKSVYSNNSLSGFSNQITSIPNIVDTIKNIAISNNPNITKLSWDIPAVVSDKFQIFRSTDTISKTLLVDTLSTNYYNDPSLVRNTKYYYWLRAIDSTGAYSNYSSAITLNPTNSWYVDSAIGNDTTGYGTLLSPYKKLQKAIDISIGSDTILVKSGTYIENLLINKKTTIISQDGALKTSIKPLLPNSQIVNFTSGALDSKIKGFKLFNGGNVRGSAIDCNFSNPIIENCIITNSAGEAPIRFYYSAARITNCLIYKNTATNVFFYDPNDYVPTITHSTIAYNVGIGTGASNSINIPIFTNSIIYGNTGGSYSGNINILNSIVQGGYPGNSTNIDANPKFADSLNNNFHLSNYSPAIGIGKKAITETKDFDLNNRIVPTGSFPDAGAYENINDHPAPYLTDSTTSTQIKISNYQYPTTGLSKIYIYKGFASAPTSKSDSISIVNSYTDTANKTLNKYIYYRFTSIGAGFNESGYSNEIKTILFTKPSLLLPNNKSYNNDTSIKFIWSKNENAIQYKLQYSLDSTFTSNVVQKIANDTSIALGGFKTNSNYYWRVLATDTVYASPWSSVNKLQTFIAKPILDSIKSVYKNLYLYWNNKDTANTKYVKIYRDSLGSANKLIDSIAGNQLSYKDSKNVILSQKYYYRIKLGNYENIESDSSNILNATPVNTLPKAIKLANKTVQNSGEYNFVKLSYSGSGSYDLDGSIASYNWYVNDSLVNSKDSILSYFFKLGTNTIKLVVIDNDGGKDTSSSILNLTALQKQFQSGILGGISAINQNYILTADTSYNSITGSSVSLLDRLGNTIIPIVVQSKIFTTPSVSSDSSIFITNGSSLNGYSKVGVSLWPTIPLGGISYVTPTIDSNLSRIYVGVSNKNFFAYDYKTGKNAWSIICDAPINTSAVISGDRKLIFTSQTGTLYGFDISKSDVQTTPKWKMSFGDIVTKSPAVDASSNIYVGTDAGRLIKFMLNSDGTVTVKWNISLSSSIQTSPIIDADSNIYVGTEKGDFYKIDRSNGSTIWSYNTGAAIHSTPNISEYGTIYVPNMNGLVTAITTDKRVLWKYQDIAAISANSLYINNMLYVASEKGTFTGIYDNPNSVNVNTSFASTDKSSITSFGSASSLNSMSFASMLDNSNSNPKSNITSNGLPTTLARTPVWGTFQGDYRRTGTLSIVCPSNLTISKDSTGSLISNTSNYIQWYKDGTAITNAVSSTFKPSTAGSYSVKNNQVGCNTIASNSYYYIVTDVINLSAGEFIKISPNPFVNQLNFDFAVKGYQRLNIEVFDLATGSKKASIQNLTPGIQINLSQLSGGTYIIKVSSNDGKINYQFKMIKL